MTDWSEAAIARRVERRKMKDAADAIWEKHLAHVETVDHPQTEQLVAASMILLARALLADA